MSDPVWLALINLLGVMVTAVAPVLGALAAIGAVWISWRNGKKVDATQQDVKSIKQAAERYPEELELMKTGAFMNGRSSGIEEERKRNTDFGKLQPEDWRG